MSYKYYSIEDNRAQLKEDCKLIRDNIDDYKGKLSYINYDIGTGKSRSFAEIIPALIRNNQRVLVLCYSYKVVQEWYKNIMEFAKQQKEKISEKIFIIASPSKFDMVETFKCPMKGDFKGVSISCFTRKICKRCPFEKEQCVVDWEQKLNRSCFPLVLTSNSLYFCHSKYFDAFDLVVFDEISNIVSNLNMHFSDIDAIHNDLHHYCVSHLDSVRALCSQIDEYIWRPMCAYRKDVENTRTSMQIDKKLIDASLLRSAIKDIDALQHECKHRFKVPLEYLRKIKSRLQKLDKLYTGAGSWFALPVFKKSTVVFTDPKRYAKNENTIIDVKLTARKNITLPNMESSSRKIAYFVLSALNTKDYVENVFRHRIGEDCHLGKDPEGNIRLNSFPNVISTVYSRKSPKNNAKYSKGYSESRSVNYTDRRAIAERIVAFVRAFPEDRIAIGGIKSVFEKLTDQSFRCPSCFHPGINGLLGTLKASNNKSRELVTYDDYRSSKEDNIDHLIPYIHFGISGTNDLKPFRALLIINVYQVNPFVQQLYCGANDDPFNITRESYNYNLNIVPARQMEGRLLRFQETVQFKYIYRLSHYDRFLEFHNRGNNGFPQTSHVFNFQTHGELDRCITGINDYKSMTFDMKECLNENHYKAFFDARDPDKTMFKDRRKWTFLISKYLEHLYRNLETAPGESLAIEEIDEIFISQHHRSREKRRRGDHFKRLEMVREYFKIQRIE